MPVQQVGKTVVIGGNQDGHLRAIIRQCQMVVDQVTFHQRLEVVLKIGDWNIEPVQIPLKPRQEQVAATVQVVIAVQDATVVRNQELGDCRNHTFACETTGSAQKQDGGAHFLIFCQITLHGSGSGKLQRQTRCQ